MSDSTAPTLQPGDTLGPYKIEALIGQGGMGEVYRAVDTRLQRPVAIKVSAKQFSDRFEREARAISALNHPTSARSTTSARTTSSWSSSKVRRFPS